MYTAQLLSCLFQGFAPHISPFTDVRDLGNLLNRAGYTMLTIVSQILLLEIKKLDRIGKYHPHFTVCLFALAKCTRSIASLQFLWVFWRTELETTNNQNGFLVSGC